MAKMLHSTRHGQVNMVACIVQRLSRGHPHPNQTTKHNSLWTNRENLSRDSLDDYQALTYDGRLAAR